MSRLVIIGGDAAGMSAAARARRTDPRLDIVVLQKSAYVSYAACGLPFLIAGQVKRPEDLVLLTPEHFRRERGIEVLVRHEVLRVDVHGRRVEGVDHETGRAFEEDFDRLVIATGGLAHRPDIPGSDLQGVFALRTIEDGLALLEFIQTARPQRAAVVGAGYIGLEMAEAFRHRGLEVTLFDARPRILPMLDAEMVPRVEAAVRAAGVVLRTGAPVTALEGASGGRVRAVRCGAERHASDLVLLATGTRPNVRLALEAGISLGDTGAIGVDRRMGTGRFGVFAAGDCAEAYHRLTGRPVYRPLGTTANRQGHVAGANAAGGSAVFTGILGTAATRAFGLEIARTGLTADEARDERFAVAVADAHAPTRSRYLPGGGSLDVRLVADRATGRLLGAQMVGEEGVAKRVDVLAAALHAGMPASQLVEMDLTYSPPVAPVVDPILVAARELLKALR